MAEFTIQGTTDPFISAQLAPGETVIAEGGAMAAMEDTIVLTGKAKGGVLKSLARAATTGESFFMQHATAEGERAGSSSPRAIRAKSASWNSAMNRGR